MLVTTSAVLGAALVSGTPGGSDAASGSGAGQQASVVHATDDSTTTVRVWGQGDAETERVREGRSYRHSNLQPASRFAAKGTEVRVAVPDDAPAMQVGIGLWGNYAAYNEGSNVGIKTFPVSPGTTTTVTAPVDGLVYLIDRSVSGSHDVTVQGGTALPVFVLGQTSNEEFTAARVARPDAPFTTFIGQRTFAEAAPRLYYRIPEDITSRVELWDRVVELTNDHVGLLENAVGLARKSPQRLHITTPDTGGGGYASAGHDRITMQANTGAASELMAGDPDDMWGFWHEVGHTYQPSAYNWSGMGEVMVNASVLDVQFAISGENRLDHQNTADVAAFFAKPVADRNFDTPGGWVQILMFDQLRRGFGETFYPRLNQALRTGLALGEVSTPDNGNSKRQLFARTAGQVADRDLRPFFEQWGFPLTEDTASALADLPPLDTAIWENRNSADLKVDHEVGPYVVPVGRVTGDEPTVVVGQPRLASAPVLADLGNTDGRGTSEVTGQALQARAPGPGTILVALRNGLGIREVLSRSTTVLAGNELLFEGLADRPVMRLATDPMDGVLRLYAETTYAAHSSWGAREYVGFELRSADDAEQVGAWSVNGNQNAHALAAGFDQEYRDGQILVVRHAEARTRLELWTDSVLQPADAAAVQRFRIVDGRFVPLGGDPVLATPGAPATLVRGTATPVEARLMTVRDVSVLSAEAIFSAPAGTTFAPGQTDLVAEVQRPGGEWDRVPALDLHDGVLSGSASVLTARISVGASDLPGGTLIRWTPAVHVSVDAAAGTSGLRYTVTGTADGAATRATS